MSYKSRCEYFIGIQYDTCINNVNFEYLINTIDIIKIIKRIPCIEGRDKLSYYCPYRSSND